jgi:hypothetical protein
VQRDVGGVRGDHSGVLSGGTVGEYHLRVRIGLGFDGLEQACRYAVLLVCS